MPVRIINTKTQVKSSTGTGASQDITHSLGVTPQFVTITPTATGATEASWISADKSKITVNVTNAKTFKVKIEA